jgi:hypothetical protein
LFGKKQPPTQPVLPDREQSPVPELSSAPSGLLLSENGNGNGNGDKLEGVITDQKLLQFFFKQRGIDAHAIATDSFLDKSRDEYNSAWLSRELVQNFVDHNSQHPGTLDGVRFVNEDLPGGGKRFRIEGDWPFEDPTGVLSPHSDKPEDRNTAGGNGIGLKQTAIRFLRDFGVQRFEINGEGWSVNYRLAKAADINRDWESMPGQVPIHKVKHDWLLADITEILPTGKNVYVIETDNAEVIRAMEQLQTLGVSKENPFLQNLDYQNQFGAIKWLPKSEGLELARGRLFINGQVMNYKEKGATAQDYWVGPEFVSIQLNNLKYSMSIDRPPVSPSDLGRYLDDVVGAMQKDDLVEQLKRSEHLWAGHVDSGYSFERQGAYVVIEKLARQLPYKGWDKKEYQEYFEGRNYVCWDRGVSDSQLSELEKQGYVVCPPYFEQVGMPKASSKLSTVEAASNETPQLSKYKREQFAQEHGMEVAYEDFSEMKDTAGFFHEIGDRLSPQVIAVEKREGKPNTLRVKLKGELPKDLLFHSLPKPKEDDQRLVYLLRGMAEYGLEKRIFKKIFTSQGEFVTTFGLDYDPVTKENILLARNVKNNSDQGVFVEIEFDEQYYQAFQEAFRIVASPNETTTAIIIEGIQGSAGDIIAQDEVKPIVELSTVGLEPPQIEDTVARRVWTAKEEQLYKEAIKKDQSLLTEEERRVLQRHEQLKQKFGEVSVTQPEAPVLDSKGNVIQKVATMSETEKARVAQMEAELPGIVEAVNKLEELVPERKVEESVNGKGAIEKYLEWRQSDQFYGQLGENAGYLTGRHLIDLINEQNQAEIAKVDVVRDDATPQDIILKTLQDKLDAIVKRMNPAEDEVNDFNIVLEPTEKQLAQLGLLRLYTQLTTEVALPNDLFIYKGTGSKGINLGQKAIGMHESLFNVKFTEALRTFGHETAHNYPEAEDHGNMFRHAMESVFVTMIDRVSGIATKLEAGETITQEERIILDVQREWDKIRSSKNASD